MSVAMNFRIRLNKLAGLVEDYSTGVNPVLVSLRKVNPVLVSLWAPLLEEQWNIVWYKGRAEIVG